jgi:hypothetical protein
VYPELDGFLQSISRRTDAVCVKTLHDGKLPFGLAISTQSVYSFPIIVPVVQRIEQGFPKAKTAFLLDFADVISCKQMTGFKHVK